MRYIRDEETVYVSVTELSSYAYQRENPGALTERYGFIRTVSAGAVPEEADESGMLPLRIGEALHNNAESDALSLDGTRREVPLEKRVVYGEYAVCVQGYADIISYDGKIHTVEELKTVSSFKSGLNPFSDPRQFAQAALYACFFAESACLPEAAVRLTYIKRGNGDRISFTAKFTRTALNRMFDALMNRFYPFLKVFAERYCVFPGEAKAMPFPYRSIREGQLDFIQTAYRTLRRGEALLASAPTGIGKTMAAVFPAVKALGEGSLDRIFYLTAKTVTGRAAMEAAAKLAKYAPHLRSVMICSKDQVCPLKKENRGAPFRMNCRFCEKTDSVTDDFGKTYISYRERELAALTELLESADTVYTLERLEQTAKAHRICPYELSLDLSEFCMMIVCDYNYVMDESVRFRRYFKNVQNTERYAFLFDEAHNLPDRTRDTYSAVLDTACAAELTALTKGEMAGDADFAALTEEFARAMDSVRRMCTDSESVRVTESGEISYGFLESSRVPDPLVRTVNDLNRLLSGYIRNGHDAAETLEPYQKKLAQFSFAVPFFDEKFRFFAARQNDSVTAELLCLDPSGILERMLGAARSVILFSATMQPMEYYREITGLREAETLELESPYERDNLCLVAFDSVSTRLNDRKGTIYDCAEIIAQTVSAREGNYIAYFPSYDYMKKVCRAFAGTVPDCDIVMQKPGMSYRERERFISLFHERKQRSMVGFCVLGGMFSEGIDLAGESLIGAIIMGTGMPQISAERNIMAAYYQEKTERGQDFAYTCPGMNKVLQAAGRVIRSENDRGVIVLVDDRLGDPNLKRLFPKHWRHMRYTGDLLSLTTILEEFWDEAEDG